jgi:hypothetical protein
MQRVTEGAVCWKAGAGQTGERLADDCRTMPVDSQGLPTAKRRPTRLTPLNLATAGLTVAWLAVACYAVTYLVSR